MNQCKQKGTHIVNRFSEVDSNQYHPSTGNVFFPLVEIFQESSYYVIFNDDKVTVQLQLADIMPSKYLLTAQKLAVLKIIANEKP